MKGVGIMQTVTIELTLNAAYYQAHVRNGTKSGEELLKELRQEIRDRVNEINARGVLNLIFELPVLSVEPRIVIHTES